MWALPSDKSSCIYFCDHIDELKASSIVNVYDVSGKHKRNKNQSRRNYDTIVYTTFQKRRLDD